MLIISDCSTDKKCVRQSKFDRDLCFSAIQLPISLSEEVLPAVSPAPPVRHHHVARIFMPTYFHTRTRWNAAWRSLADWLTYWAPDDLTGRGRGPRTDGRTKSSFHFGPIFPRRKTAFLSASRDRLGRAEDGRANGARVSSGWPVNWYMANNITAIAKKI